MAGFPQSLVQWAVLLIGGAHLQPTCGALFCDREGLLYSSDAGLDPVLMSGLACLPIFMVPYVVVRGECYVACIACIA